MRAFVYILGASGDPNNIRCKVPYEIDKNEIFFGPCKKKLRKKMKSEVDENGKLNSETYFIGLNAGNPKKIVWAGKIKQHFTFQKANEKLVESKYLPITKGDCFPLHVIPIENGYQLVSKLHSEKKAWIKDLVSNKNQVKYHKNSNSITLKKGYTFDRDICFIFSNIFFAKGGGIEIDENILKIFREHFNNDDIDKCSVFGKDKNKNANGMRGGWVELDNTLTKRIIKLIKGQAKKNNKHQASSETKTSNKTIQNKKRGCK